MACKLAPFLAFLGGLFLLFLLSVPSAIGQNTIVKVGVCPKLQERENCTQECNSDGECSDNLKCCSAGCSSFCTIPNEKKGTCPEIDSSISTLGVCQDQCQEDSECMGQLKCCRNGCGKVSCLVPKLD